jgi:hypothetical protein
MLTLFVEGSCDNFNLHSKQYQDQRGTKCSCTAAMLTDEKLDPISANRRGRKRDSSSPLLLRLEPRHGNDENVCNNYALLSHTDPC